MKPSIFLLSILSLISTSIFSQRYLLEFENEASTELLDKAEKSYVNKNYVKSAKLYGKIMAIEGESPQLLFNQLTSLVHTIDTLKIEEAFSKLTNSDWLDCNYLSKNKDFGMIKYRTVFKMWQKAVRACATNDGIFNEKITHPELRQQLLWLKMQDINADVNLIHKVKYGADNKQPIEALKLERKKIYVDNFFTLLEIVEANGWMGYKEVGRDGAEAVWMITQHANHVPSMQADILKQMEKAMQEGNFEKKYYAHLYDRVQANYRQPQKYGTLRYKNTESGNWELYRLEDTSKVVQYREEMGLPPLKEN